MAIQRPADARPVAPYEFRGFNGVIGQAARPQALPYRRDMSLMDVLIAVGGVTEFASGNNASIIRKVDGKLQNVARSLARASDQQVLASQTTAVTDQIIALTQTQASRFRGRARPVITGRIKEQAAASVRRLPVTGNRSACCSQ